MGRLTTELTTTAMMAISNPGTLDGLYINTTQHNTRSDKSIHTHTTHTLCGDSKRDAQKDSFFPSLIASFHSK